MPFKVTLASAENGEEDFEYPSRKEQRKGFNRLVTQSAKYYKQDGVERQVTLHVTPTVPQLSETQLENLSLS